MPSAATSSPDEAVSGTGVLLPQDDCKAHQEQLKMVAQNLGIQVEVVRVLS